MTIINLTPRQENITGASLGGSDGDANRTYTLTFADFVLAAGIDISLNGSRLTQGAGNDFTISSSTITFLNNVWDNQVIVIDYFTSVSSSEATTDYANTLQVFEFLNWIGEVPEFESGQTPSFETVDESGSLATGSIIYLDHNRVISGTLTLSYGASAASTTDLTEDTHYTLDLEKGQITILEAGATAISTDSVYAEEYKYTLVNDRPGPTDSHVDDLISRASILIDEYVSQTFSPVTQITNELFKGKGKFDFQYRVKNKPLNFVNTELSSAVSTATATFPVDSTTGFIAGQKLSVEKEAVTIVSVDSSVQLTVSRASIGTTGVAHAADSNVVNALFEVSNTAIGAVPTYSFQEYAKNWVADKETDVFTFLNNDVTPEGLFISNYPEKGVPDRVRVTYNYGRGFVPAVVTHACVSQVCKWLVTGGYAKRAGEGIDNDEFDVVGVLSEQVKEILKEYKVFKADGF